MSNFHYKFQLRVAEWTDVVLVTVPFTLGWYLAYAPHLFSPYFQKGNWLIIALFAIIYVAYNKIYDGFQISLNRISEVLISQTIAVLITDGILFIVIWLLTKSFPSIFPMIIVLIMQVLLAAVWCWLAHKWYFGVFPPKRTAVIYDQREGMEQLISQYGLGQKFSVVATSDVKSALEDSLHILDGMQVVFLCGVRSHERNIILKHCIAQGIQLYLIPRIGDVLMSGSKRMHMFHLPMLKVGRYSPSIEYLFLKRLLDIVVCALSMVILLPVMGVVAIAIKATDGGPIFYRQCRLTKDGKRFFVLKFRSMRVDAEKDGVARLSSGEKDDRITSVGRIIRKFRLDELPQLFNILSGDMSLVGPRPERPEIACQYQEYLPEFALRLQAKAGLTGYAQVYGKYNTTPYDKLQMDLMYIAEPSIIEDLKIIFATIKILFEPESTEGVDVGQVTANKEKEVNSIIH